MEISVPMFIWIPPDRTTKWTVKIGTTDISNDIISSTFTPGLVGEELGFEIELQNSGQAYTNSFVAGNLVELDFDFSNGTTVQFVGKIEFIKNKISNGMFNLNIKGGHLTSDLLDVTVTTELTNTNVSDALKSIIDSYLTGYTYSNVETISTTISTIKWNNKPFLDCVLDLMKVATADCYIDNNKDFHFFARNSKINNNEAVVWNDSLIELKGLGQDSVDVRNKIIVYGEADGLPVLHTSQDSTSQTLYGVKEKIVTDTSIINENQAKDLGDAESSQIKDPPFKGSADCLLMPLLNPGDLVYISTHEITDTFRLIKYTFMLPDERMELFFSKDIGIAKLFKERITKDLGQETIQNPFKMLYSYTLPFDDFNNIDTAGSSNVTVSNGKLILVSGTLGTMITSIKNTPVTVSNCHLIVKGSNLAGTLFSFSADGSDNFQPIIPDTLTVVTNTGTQLRLKIVLNSASTEIDAVAFLYK